MQKNPTSDSTFFNLRVWFAFQRITKSRTLLTAFVLGTTALFGASAQGQQYQVLHHFLPAPALPFAGLIQGSDGNFYGTTSQGGGTTNQGTVFKMNSSGAVTTLHSFAGPPLDGANPEAGLIQGSDGNFYGTTSQGGATNNGTVFKMDSSGVVTTLHSFAVSDGSLPHAGLIQGSDGNFYGTTNQAGATNNGTVFKMDSSGAVTTLHSFLGQPLDGASPEAGLIQGSDGNFYGTTNLGGATNQGMVFKMDSSGVVTTLHSFLGPPLDGANPRAGLIQVSDGNFYGTTNYGGATNQGTVFKMDSSGAVTTLVTTLHSFAGPPLEGANPRAGLILGSDGNFYGTTSFGGDAGNGTAFKMDSLGAVTTLHSFAGPPLDGTAPYAGLIQGSDGNFYGTTVQGGPTNKGTVFKMDSSGAVTTHFFAASDGANPKAGLIQGSDGNFYGTTLVGGATNQGTVFKMDSSGVGTTLHSFAGSDGANPQAGLIQGSDGNFYGTTLIGGTTDKGTVFKMDSLGVVTTLHSFAGSDGQGPYAGLIQGSDGNFYGTTSGGGASNKGTVFKMDSLGAVTTLHSFAGSDGATPFAGLIQGSDGNFYGTTSYGGATNIGTAFKIDSSGALTTLHSFSGSDGAYLFARLMQGSDGNFYGMTWSGGATDNGTVFKMDSSGVVTTLHSFAGSDGANPYAGLSQGSDGNFYGTTVLGGTYNNGTVFKMDSSGAVTTLHSFAGFLRLDGANPYAGLIQGSDGNFYGTTLNGGAANNGTVFRINIAQLLLSAVSRKTHGNAGTFDISLPLTGDPGIECRSGGRNGDYTMVFSFANTLTSVAGASVTSGAGTVSSSSIGADTHQYVVNLTGVANAQTITVSLTNVNDSAGNLSSSVAATMGVLLGDTTSNGTVNSSDIGQAKANSGQTTSTPNFRTDVTVNGVINSSDIGTIKAQSGTSLP